MSKIEFVNHSTVTLYKSNASDLDVCRSAWVSQNTEAHEKEAEEGRVEGLINFLVRNGHHSTLEHGQFTFIVETPIFVAREVFRHRSSSFSEISARYVEMKPRFYVPSLDRPTRQEGKVGNYTFTQDKQLAADAQRHIKNVSNEAWNAYQAMLESGVAREVARDVLPVNLLTTFWMTVNPRNLMHFLDLRTAPDALQEIRLISEQMETIFEQQMPLTHKAWKANK